MISENKKHKTITILGTNILMNIVASASLFSWQQHLHIISLYFLLLNIKLHNLNIIFLFRKMLF